MFSCYNDNFFATQFHVDLFQKTFDYYRYDGDSIHVVGWPMEYPAETLAPFAGAEKENIVSIPT